MVKLSCKGSNSVFYFNTMEDCDKYKAVFEDHWCNIPWNTPVEVDPIDVPDEDLALIANDPEVRADKNLPWGFNLTKSLGIGLTTEQKATVQEIMKITGKGQ